MAGVFAEEFSVRIYWVVFADKLPNSQLHKNKYYTVGMGVDITPKYFNDITATL